MGTRAEVPPGTLYMLILKSLGCLGSMHGYGIALHIQQGTNDVLQVEEGTLYPALQRMLVRRWVKAEWRKTENNRRARYYTLTAEGRKQLATEIQHFDHVMGAIRQLLQHA